MKTVKKLELTTKKWVSICDRRINKPKEEEEYLFSMKSVELKENLNQIQTNREYREKRKEME